MEDIPTQIQFPHLASEISAMREADQNMRKRNLDDDSWEEGLDENNTKRMKEIVHEIGWPSVSKVGADASRASWLLVQHADHDVAFQSHCLALMQELPSGEVQSRNIAFLTDRVRVNSGQPQLYGTQFKQVDGKHVPKDIEDPEHVDERRKSMGLDTLADNIALMELSYPLK
ncbi:MAG: hypothetical protein A2566_03690 [Candidatus Zambryskibacteria bacterium RIFOXYD1_FULL_40_13]|nr:MAG: hypothetical protein UT25_C0002G0210 [Parcubacteria group bacterium GW2011_GWC1_39_12]KKR19290.1 MAG: hypothetical protein UT49_C0002G0136 [Parcubacteria group bacterium GW2011_GWF1_39_37]KKR35327.1 MAG: hypothetical protein UT68_C0004G0135 [Parcubacteria group bacterium GW2011_GWC2_40_10]KKR52241.1 MAG: hypothetical protein UT89_C0002G0042 [Parcubacteria group bacterium GW2011_GWE1_40_20]KKR65738.1 MAG: hypothetical protein UU06_C0012G0034 [Parcubacteria group bacterium GW2011_GWB1_40_